MSPEPTRRQALGLAGGTLCAGVLAACSGGSGGGRESTPPGTLSQWYHQYSEQGAHAAVKRYAAAYPRGTVHVRWVDGNYDQKAADALVTRDSPDIFEYANGPTIDMITGGQVVDVTGLLGSARSDFTSTLLQRMTYEGKLYGIPQVVDLQLFVYRKSMLRKAKVDPPQTFEELIAAAEALTGDGVKGIFLGNDGGASVVGGPVLWSSGYDYLTADNQPGFHHPEVLKALKALHTLYTSGHLLLGSPTDWSDPRALIQGKTAIQWTGLWALPQITTQLGDDVGVMPFPAIAGGVPSVPVGAYASCVSARADVEAAKDFVQWLWVEQTDDQLDFAQSYGLHVPARKSLMAQANRLDSGVAQKAAGFVDHYGHPQTPLLWTPASASAWVNAMTKIIRSGADPEPTLSGVEGTVSSELQRFKGS